MKEYYRKLGHDRFLVFLNSLYFFVVHVTVQRDKFL
jgi:hypothetical protein